MANFKEIFKNIFNVKSKSNNSTNNNNNEFCSDKADWKWELVYNELFKQSKIKVKDLSDEDETKIWRISSNQISFFLAWLIENDLYDSEGCGLDDSEIYLIADIKNKKSNPTDFIIDELDCTLSRDDIKEELLPFMDEYYVSKFETDFQNFFENVLHKNCFLTEFSWDDYSKFKKIMDEKYLEFKNNN